jgi:hypothetical protein
VAVRRRSQKLAAHGLRLGVVLAAPFDTTTMDHVARLQVFESQGVLRFRIVVRGPQVGHGVS